VKLLSLTCTLACALLFSAVALAQDDTSGAADKPADKPAADTAAAPAKDTGGDKTVSAEEQAEPEETVGKPLSDRIKAVSRKSFLKKNRFELSPSAGLSVNDAFFRSYFFNIDAGYHIMEPFSVELRLGISPIDEKLEPVRFLRDEAYVLTELARPFYLADLSGTFTPLYGKISLFSDWIWHYDLYVDGGGGVLGVWKTSSGIGNPITALAHQPMLSIGGGMRGFINEWLVVHVDVRDYIYPTVLQSLSTVQNLLVLSVGVGFFFPFGFEYEYDGYKVES